MVLTRRMRSEGRTEEDAVGAENHVVAAVESEARRSSGEKRRTRRLRAESEAERKMAADGRAAVASTKRQRARKVAREEEQWDNVTERLQELEHRATETLPAAAALPRPNLSTVASTEASEELERDLRARIAAAMQSRQVIRAVRTERLSDTKTDVEALRRAAPAATAALPAQPLPAGRAASVPSARATDGATNQSVRRKRPRRRRRAAATLFPNHRPTSEASPSRPVDARSLRRAHGPFPATSPLEAMSQQAVRWVQAAATGSASAAFTCDALANDSLDARLSQLFWHGPESATLLARRVVVTNVPPTATSDSLQVFLVQAMLATKCASHDYAAWQRRHRDWITALARQAHRRTQHPYAAGLAIAAGAADVQPPPSFLPFSAVRSVQRMTGRPLAFVECTFVAEATGLMALSGLLFQGYQLRMRRPREFDADAWTAAFTASAASATSVQEVTTGLREPPAGFSTAALQEQIVSPEVDMSLASTTTAATAIAVGADRTPGAPTPAVCYVGGIPHHFTELQVLERLRVAAAEQPLRLQAFVLMRESSTGLSRGFAFVQWHAADASMAPEAWQCAVDAVLEALCSMPLPETGRPLTARRATLERPNAASHTASQGEMKTGELGDVDGATVSAVPVESTSVTPSRPVLALQQLLAADVAGDQAEVTDIVEEMREEFAAYGTVVEVRVQPETHTAVSSHRSDATVYVQFATDDEARAAWAAMQHRQFDGRPVHAALVPLSELPQALASEMCVLQLVQLASRDALRDAQERQDILEDVREELALHAPVMRVWLADQEEEEGEQEAAQYVSVCAAFAQRADAQRAAAAVHGRYFDGRRIQTRLQ